MANIPTDLRYTAEHEYVKQTGDAAIVQVGITDYAQGELGDVVYVDLPKVGAALQRGAAFGTIEAVKAVSELYAPASGTVTEVNQALHARALLRRDVDYIVREGRIELVDEFTGRVVDDRRWPDGHFGGVASGPRWPQGDCVRGYGCG